MPQSPTPNMALILPTPGSDTDSWGDELNAAGSLIDAHGHIPGQGVPIVTAAIEIDADLTFGGSSAVHLKSADFDEVSGVSSGARRIFWSADDHELYARTAGGVNVKITNGSGLNVTSVGGIGGDYVAIGAAVAYDDANDRYTFKQQTVSSVAQWARLDAADLDLYEYHAAGNVTNVANRVRLSSPASLAASYGVTFPAALPGSQLAIQMDTSGNLVVSNTFPGAITSNSGLSTFSSLTTGGDYHYSGTWTLIVPVSAALLTGSLLFNGGAPDECSAITLGTVTTPAFYPIRIRQGDRIKAFRVHVNKTANTSVVTVALRKCEIPAGGGGTATISTASNSGAGGNITVGNSGVNYTAIVNESYDLRVTGGGISGDFLYYAEIDIDRP